MRVNSKNLSFVDFEQLVLIHEHVYHFFCARQISQSLCSLKHYVAWLNLQYNTCQNADRVLPRLNKSVHFLHIFVIDRVFGCKLLDGSARIFILDRSFNHFLHVFALLEMCSFADAYDLVVAALICDELIE